MRRARPSRADAHSHRSFVRLLDPGGAEKEFDESQHPRDEQGRFSETDSAASGSEVVGGYDVAPGEYGSVDQIGSSTLRAVSEAQVAKAEARLTEEGFSPEKMRENIDAQMQKALNDPEIWAEGMMWYEREHELAQQLAAKYGLSDDDAAAVLAAVSPRISVDKARDAAGRVGEAIERDSEVKVTADMIEMRYQKALEFADGEKNPAKARAIREKAAVKRARWLRDELGQSYNVTKGDVEKVSSWHPLREAAMTDGWTKGLRIARGETPDEVLSGPKVRSFYDNIRNPTGSDSVTIDSWMVKALTGEHEATEKQSAKWLGGTPQGGRTSGRYEVFSRRVREAAIRYGITPLQTQAIIWTAMQR